MDAGGGDDNTVVALLTFAVVALHQARLPDLNVEGFVLLVLLVVDYFHLDGFTEEVGGRGGKGREKRRKERGNRSKVRGRRLQKAEKREAETRRFLSPEKRGDVRSFSNVLDTRRKRRVSYNWRLSAA